MYKIIWVISFFVSDPCPGISYTDEFGRIVNGGISCAAIHGHTEYEKHSKVFTDLDLANDFYSRILKEKEDQGIFTQNKIDSVEFIKP